MLSLKHLTQFLISFPFTLSLPSLDAQSHNLQCKPLPSSPHWPTLTEWNSLNNSLSGRLLAPTPPGAVCHPSESSYDNATCGLVTAQWTNSSFHALNPLSVDYNDDTCPPNATLGCSTRGYPAYVVNASKAEDVSEAVRFAAKTGVRLVVKGTGHDIPTRSSGAGSLSIWTHYIRGIDISIGGVEKYAGNGSTPRPIGTAKFAAGMRGGEILAAAAKKNVTIVTGADPGVGIGGWVTGGGHGPVTSLYGLGADQVVEMEVVVADGRIIKLNEKRNKDLFWAMRGGGGGTFAILISVTLKVYPNISLVSTLYSFNTTASSQEFWTLSTLFHTQIPRLSDAGAAGYYYGTPATPGVPVETGGQLQGVFLFPNKTIEQAEIALAPLFAAINSTLGKKVVQGHITTSSPSFSEGWAANPVGTVGQNVAICSRLLDSKALTADPQKLEAALRASTPEPWTYLGHIVAGKGVRDAAVTNGENAVLPAWRQTYSHLIGIGSWPQGNETAKAQIIKQTQERADALKQLAPETGAYVNEGDPRDPEWKKTFYGANYERLLAVKTKWDPKGVFWCRSCVGWDKWEVKGKDGIGQDIVELCRK